MKKFYSDDFDDKEFQFEVSNAFNSIYNMIKNSNIKCESKLCNYYCNINLLEKNNLFSFNNVLSRNTFENGNCLNFNKYESNPYS